VQVWNKRCCSSTSACIAFAFCTLERKTFLNDSRFFPALLLFSYLKIPFVLRLSPPSISYSSGHSPPPRPYSLVGGSKIHQEDGNLVKLSQQLCGARQPAAGRVLWRREGVHAYPPCISRLAQRRTKTLPNPSGKHRLALSKVHSYTPTERRELTAMPRHPGTVNGETNISPTRTFPPWFSSA